MNALQLTAEVFAQLEQDNPLIAKAMRKDPAYKQIILDFDKQNASEDIDFSNQEVFTIDGIGQVSLYGLALLAYSSLDKEETKTYTNKKTGVEYTVVGSPKLYAMKSPAWDALRRIQRGKVAQGQAFSLENAALREYLEASL